MQSLNSQIGMKLRLLRLRNKMSQSDLGQVLDMEFRDIQALERGQMDIFADTLYIVSQHFEVCVSYFYEELNEGNRSATVFNLDGSVH